MSLFPHAPAIRRDRPKRSAGPIHFAICLIAFITLSSGAAARTPPAPIPPAPTDAAPVAGPPRDPAKKAEAKNDDSRGAVTPPESPATTAPSSGDAEKILGMRRLLDSDRKQKVKYEEEQATLQLKFDEVSAEFERNDVELANAKTRLDNTTDEAIRVTLTKTIERLERARTRKRDEFELIIARRKAIQQQLVTLNEKLVLVKDYLERLSSSSVLPIPSTTPAPPVPAVTPAVGPPSNTAAPTMPSIPGMPSFNQPAAAPATPAPDDEQLDEALKAAKRERMAKLVATQEAEQRIARLERAVDIFERDLVNSRELLKISEKAVAATDTSVKSMNARLKERRESGEPEEKLTRFRARRDDVQRRGEIERTEMDAQADRVAKSEVVLERIKRSRNEARQALIDRNEDLDAADRRVWFLSSPIAPYQLTTWFSNKGPRVLLVIAFSVAMYWGAKLIGSRVVGKVVQRSSRGGKSERESRAETLRRVFESTAGVAIIVLGILSALNQAGINVTVLLGGAAVIGAAIAFGSQNLIKDYFSGFMILMENQYSVGNVIKVGAITGSVENITLRMTSIRDLEGVLHFIPHSQVLSVSNLTYGWSRIVMDIKVSSGEDPDRVMDTLLEVGRDLRTDTVFGSQLIGEPEMLGVDSLSGGGTIIKMLVKTKPLNRWPVKREMLRRIKKRFDADGIKMA